MLLFPLSGKGSPVPVEYKHGRSNPKLLLDYRVVREIVKVFDSQEHTDAM
jgi:hypothetical protein